MIMFVILVTLKVIFACRQAKLLVLAWNDDLVEDQDANEHNDDYADDDADDYIYI